MDTVSWPNRREFRSHVNILNSMRLNQEQVTFKYTGCIRKFTDNGNRILNEILA